MEIINLITFTPITDENQPAGPVTAMFVHARDEAGNPSVWEVKTYYPPEE